MQIDEIWINERKAREKPFHKIIMEKKRKNKKKNTVVNINKIKKQKRFDKV